MNKLRLKITGVVSLGGYQPGEEFLVPSTDGKTPTDTYWRNRLEDEANYNIGAVTVVASPPAKAVTRKKKGDS